MKFKRDKNGDISTRKDGQVITIRQNLPDEWQVDYRGDTAGLSTQFWPSIGVAVLAENDIEDRL